MSKIKLGNTSAFEPKQDEMTVPLTDSHSERSKLLAMLDDFSPTKTNEVSPAKDVNESFSPAKVSPAKKMREYKKNRYDTIQFDAPKGLKQRLKDEAERQNLSPTKLIHKALTAYFGEEWFSGTKE